MNLDNVQIVLLESFVPVLENLKFCQLGERVENISFQNCVEY